MHYHCTGYIAVKLTVNDEVGRNRNDVYKVIHYHVSVGTKENREKRLWSKAETQNLSCMKQMCLMPQH